MATAEEIRREITLILAALGHQQQAKVMLESDIPPEIEGEVREIVGPVFDEAAKLMKQEESELLGHFKHVVLLSAQRRKEFPPPFMLWAIDICARSIENGEPVGAIAKRDHARDLLTNTPHPSF